MKNFEEYLRAQNECDHILRCHENEKGELVFSIHPANVDGDTLYFKVAGEAFTAMQPIEAESR